MTIPVGEASTGKTFCKVMRPSARRNIATPFADFGFMLVRETKSQQPSLLAIELKGWPGSETKETGSLGATLHRPAGLVLAVCAHIEAQNNPRNNAIPMSRCAGAVASSGFLMKASFDFESLDFSRCRDWFGGCVHELYGGRD
jgi:hypothetical protein